MREADCLEILLKGPAVCHRNPVPLMNLLHYLKHKHVDKINIESGDCTHKYITVLPLYINLTCAYGRPLQSSAFILSPDAYEFKKKDS